MVIRLEGPFFFSLFGLPFIILGLYFVLGRFLLLAYLRKHTFYILTTEKIIRRCGKKIDYLSIKNLPCVYVTTHKNGYGTISFEPQSLLTIVEWMNVFYFTKKGFSLENIQNVVHVQKMILDAQKKKL